MFKEGVLGAGEHRGFKWQVVHNNMGFRCGYIQVLPGHPWHGKHYDEVNEDVDVHGGLTFSRFDKKDYWLGFDCAHCFDGVDTSLPHNSVVAGVMKKTVRTQEYVEMECKKLCEQAELAERSKDD